MPSVTERSAVDLAAGIRRREVTSLEIVDAHVQRLRATHAQINAVVADRYEDALAEAQVCDQRIAQAALRGEPLDELPPLYGVPFTVKESIAVEGMPQTAGVLARKDQKGAVTATAVQRLIDAGAILLGVTNTSELTLWIESDNQIYGRTNNPYDRSRTAGGSSGGEGAAVGVGGSPFGIGADIGGSIRIPALFNGVFGHKPSRGLVPNTGIWPTVNPSAETLLATGPLTRRAEDLMPLLRILAAADLPDPAEVSLDGLTVTTVENFTRWPLAPALRDARERAAGALASAGATVRTVSLPSWREVLLPFLAMLQDDPGSHWRPTRELLTAQGDHSVGIRDLVLGRGGHTLPTRLTLLGEALPNSKKARRKMLARARELSEELEEAIGDGVLLHPAQLTLAPKHRHTYGRPWLTNPASIFNLAGVPVTEVPIGLSPDGLPAGVQVAAGHGADHLTIAIAIELEAVFGGWRAPTNV